MRVGWGGTQEERRKKTAAGSMEKEARSKKVDKEPQKRGREDSG